MRFAVDAHAIGRHLTGNEVYIRSLLRAFAEIDRHSEFVAYLSEPGAEDAGFRSVFWSGASRPIPTRGWAGISRG